MKVLLIEDNISLASIIQIMLEDEGINVDYSDDGLKGLKLFKENLDYDAVITDIRLPGLNGYEILKILKNWWHYSSYYNHSFWKYPWCCKGNKIWGIWLYNKPFDNDEFLIVIKKAIEFKKLKSENLDLKNLVKSFIKPEIIGESKKIQEVKILLERLPQQMSLSLY